MSKYNSLLNSHFKSCRLLVEGRDPHRDRQVQVRMIPGDFSIVGISDGIDSWIAPISVAPSDLFDKVRRVMHDIQAGKDPAPETARRPRVRISPTGRAIDEQQESQRLLSTALDQQATIRRRIHVRA